MEKNVLLWIFPSLPSQGDPQWRLVARLYRLSSEGSRGRLARILGRAESDIQVYDTIS